MNGSTVAYDDCLSPRARSRRGRLPGAENLCVPSTRSDARRGAGRHRLACSRHQVVMWRGLSSPSHPERNPLRAAPPSPSRVARASCPAAHVDEACSTIVARWLEDHGFTIRAGATLTISKVERASESHLHEGRAHLRRRRDQPRASATTLEWPTALAIEVCRRSPAGGILVDDHYLRSA